MKITNGSPWTYRLLVLLSLVVVAVVVFLITYFVTKNAYEEDDSETSTVTVDLLAIPDGFMMGTATAAYQIEGAWNESGKGENIWDRLCHNASTKTLVEDEDNGDVACDSYNLYKTDVQIINETGFQVYRFSIAWSRVLPNGTTDYVNSAGIQYYHDLIEELLAYNITPLATLYHWDLPQALEDLGGWTNPDISDYFADYADLMFKEYGDQIKWWITLNEPKQVRIGYGSLSYAPARNDHGISDYIAVHNLLKSHGKAYKVYNDTYRSTQQGKVGITLDSSWFLPLDSTSTADQEAAARLLAFEFEIFSHPIFSKEGNYPSVVRERVDKNSFLEGRNHSRLPYFTDEEVDYIRGSYDFFGLNHYYYSNVTSSTNGTSPSFALDSETVSYGNDSYYPEGRSMRYLLNFVKDRYDNPPVLITENGCPSYMGLNDTDRIYKYHGFIKNVLLAIYEDSCNVIGYTAWSFMDNFEWMFGYTKRFGLWHVDFTSDSRTRTMKQSGYWYQKLLRTRRLPNITDY